MKAVIFIHVLYLILMRTFMVKGAIKCESKIELRAVLLSCPPKDTGCDDDDPLSQAMKSEECQILQANTKNFESLKEEKQRGFPNEVKDCKRKIVITIKVKNAGPIPCDDEYIVIDHVFDPLTGGRGRLLSPVVLKLRQEQMIQLYRLKFQRVVNSDPFEEQKAADKTCSVDPENPTCGIAMYDGKPIPFSEGFCCSTDPHVNAKRQLSPVSHGDSLLYRDYKLISQGHSRLVRGGDKSGAIVNPELVRLESATGDDTYPNKKGSDCGGITDPKNWDRVPNFLLENDRKIVCDRGDFMSELCKLQEDKNRGESDVRGGNIAGGRSGGSVGLERSIGGMERSIGGMEGSVAGMERSIGGMEGSVAGIEEIVMDKPGGLPAETTAKVSLNRVNPAEIGQVKNLVVLQGLVKAMDMEQTTLGVGLAENYGHEKKGSRGKRENRKENKKLSLEEKLERFASANKHLTKRRKRLLELSRKRFRKSGDQCGSGQPCPPMTATDYLQDDYVRSPPPKYFFSHDKYIIDPLETPEGVMNTTCPPSEGAPYDSGGSPSGKNYQPSLRIQMYKNLGDEKMQKSGGYYQKQGKMKFKDKYLVGKIASKKDRVSLNQGGRIENTAGKSKVMAQGIEEPLRQVASLRGEKRFSLYRGSGERGVKDDTKSLSGEDYLLHQKNRFHGKNLKGFLHKNSHEKKLLKPRIRNFFMAKNRERQKFKSELVRGQKKFDVEPLGKENFEEKSYKELLKEDVNKNESQENEIKTTDESKEQPDMKSNEEESPENLEMPQTPEMPEMSENPEVPQSSETQEMMKNTESSEKPDVYGPTTKKYDLDRMEYSVDDKLQKDEEPPPPPKPVNKYVQKLPQANHPESRTRPNDEISSNIDFNVEIIHNALPEITKHRHHSLANDQHLKNRMKISSAPLENKVLDFGKSTPMKARLNLYYKPPERYYIIENGRFTPQGLYLIQGPSGAFVEGKNRQHYAKERPGTADRAETPVRALHYKKPLRRYYVPLVEYAEKEPSFRQRQVLSPSRENNVQESRGKRYSELWQRFEGGHMGFEEVDDDGQPLRGKGRRKRSASYSFEPARGFLRSELESGVAENQLVHELEGCVGRQKVKKGSRGESCTGGINGWELSRAKHENLSIDAKAMEGVDRRFGYPAMASRVTEKREKKGRKATDKERLAQSYLNAADYVREEMRGFLKGKRETVEQNKSDKDRGGQSNDKDFAGEYTQDTAHCMRFGDLWYSMYSIKRPVVAQIVGIQLYDKHSQCDGTAKWRELTKGKMIRVGTFLPKAEDELPSISITFVGGKTNKVQSTIDPENYLLLIPSHVSDPSKLNSYPQLEAGPEEYLLVESNDVSLGGECNMIGTSFEAFARQPDRCSQRRGSCLKRQPVDLWREDMEARIRGKRGKYFVENFGTVPNSPVKTYTNLTGEFLALEYYGEYTSVIEIEVKADSNAIIRKGSNAQIPLVYIDSTYPKKIRIMLSVLNIGLTASYFRPRLGDCPPDLDPAWCPLEGPLVIIPPQQRHDFKLDLSGILPASRTFMTVQVLNQLNRKIAHRKIVIKKGDRCVCAFHCKCTCVGNLISGKTCQKLNMDEYKKAGYIGQYPFRGGAASSPSESILGNIHIVFLTAFYVLFILGMMKGLLGVFLRRVGIAGTRVITGPRQLSQYYECELQCCSILYDDYGFPIHPTTCQPVQIIPLWLEIIVNFLFFFLYPLRGIWFLLMSLPCCKMFCIECDTTSAQLEECEGADSDHKCSSPLLSKCPQPTCVHYNLVRFESLLLTGMQMRTSQQNYFPRIGFARRLLRSTCRLDSDMSAFLPQTTFNAKKSKQDEYLPYLPYKGDDDPLEEDDTEFVLQEMKRYRKK